MNYIRIAVTAVFCIPLLSSAGMLDEAKEKIRRDSEEQAILSMDKNPQYYSAVRKYRENPKRSGPPCYLTASEHWSMWTGVPKQEFAACDEVVRQEIQSIYAEDKRRSDEVDAIVAKAATIRAQKDARIEEEERELDRTAGPLRLNPHAGDMRPTVVHFPDRSCISKHIGNETFVNCGEYQNIVAEMGAENTRIDTQIRDEARYERRERVAKAKSKSELTQQLADIDEAGKFARKVSVDNLFATAPKGWACVQKRLPLGKDILDSTDKDEAACAKAFKGKQN
ncbi:hypothetical protein D0T25_07005 [Duganella sp. BJB488]|uniref:hypothetical protein n=1 Tax=unclassified Duganella TaxID=2636909 RepID=UPI000E356081|nr:MULTISPECIES: hypothetical protein [unclassified Duganella]RFP23123.1 hypothetical protein D0T26_08845 [Duganella sp. BJB489]RFP24802.1 hypothetical protein D0T25_07005 [Duganella sp. BJB488]RFP34121.1 hypothetical protein D0T24_17225 [Duganella sp. BJB480]